MKRRIPGINSRLIDIPEAREYSPAMDADFIQMGQVVNVDDLVQLDHERSARAAFELRRMLGAGCVDFGKLLGILEQRAVQQ